MYRQLAYLGLGAGAIATAAFVGAVGCGGGGGSQQTYDFSMKKDGGGNKDANAGTDGSNVSYMTTTIHDIDTATIGSPLVTKGTAVQFTSVTVLAPPNGFSTTFNGTAKAGCRYEVWVQDPQCTTPPCGLVIETQAMANPNGTGQFCPYADANTDPLNVLHDTWTGDVIDVKGTIFNFDDTGSAFDGGPSADLNQHEIQLDSINTTTVKGNLPAATVVTDTDPSMFVPYTGSGWAMYEGMLITLKPASGKFTTTLNTSSNFSNTCTGVTGKTNGSFTTSPGGAEFADTYAGFYIQKDAGEMTNCWPTNGLTFSSVGGIVSTGFGGSILPTSASDFQP